MKTMPFCLLLPVLLLLTSACHREADNSWTPVYAETDFHYLEETTGHGLASLQQGISAETTEERSKALDETQQHLLALRDYFIPLTEVRQMLFDADRLAASGQRPEARTRLQEVRSKLLETAETDHGGVRTALLEVIASCDELLHKLDLEGSATRAEFDELIHKLNLLLTRGDLVIAGARFKP